MMVLPERFRTNDKNTFGAFTAETRWPILCQNAIADLDLELENCRDNQEKLRQGHAIREQLQQLRQDLLQNKPLCPFTQEEASIASIPSSFNEYLSNEGQGTSWLNGEWLFCEIYFYRRINCFFRSQPLWSQFDIFDRLKQETFRLSFHGVTELAIRYRNLAEQLQTASKDTLSVLFKEFIEISLWGNATDLSLLTNATLEDIKSVQGAKAREKSESKIIINDTDKLWENLSALSNGDKKVRIDFVLDNSGFELYADLMLAAFLLQANLASKCIFHAKDIPYMVSDVMLKDFDNLVKDLKDRDFFPATENSEESNALNQFADDISAFVSRGQLEFREDSFWTTDLDYWSLDPSDTKYRGAQLHNDLLNSDLVIFKGDLNYRKLTGDRKWPRTTPWETAIGPLATNGITLVSLRTCKADVQVGLRPGVDEELCKVWEKDHPGQGSWWSSSGKWAVICYTSSHKG